MIPIAGSIGIGMVWGWLVGGRYILDAKPIRSLLFIILTCSVLAGIVYFFGGWTGVLAYLISLVLSASLHHLWRAHLLHKWMPRDDAREMEG